MADDAMPSFGRLVLHRAFANTWSILRRRAVEAALGGLSLIIGAPLFLFLFGAAAVKEQVWTFIAFVFAPGGVFILVTFLWNLAIAPEELVYEELHNHPDDRRAQRQREKPHVNWTVWKKMKAYTVYELAGILTKEEPNGPMLTAERDAFRKLVMEGISDGGGLQFITEFVNPTGLPSQRYPKPLGNDTKIERAAAIAWAKAKGFPVEHIE